MMIKELLLYVLLTVLLLEPIGCQKMLGDPSAEAGEPMAVAQIYEPK